MRIRLYGVVGEQQGPHRFGGVCLGAVDVVRCAAIARLALRQQADGHRAVVGELHRHDEAGAVRAPVAASGQAGGGRSIGDGPKRVGLRLEAVRCQGPERREDVQDAIPLVATVHRHALVAALHPLHRTEGRIERNARISQLEYNFDGTPKGYDNQQNEQAKVTGFLYDKRVMIAELKQKLQSAFLGYNSDNISVIDRKDGGIAVVFSESLLFPSGNEQVDINGRRSLVQLTDVISPRIAELDIRIEGHVNSEAIAERNWDVSTLRAVSVAKVLTAYGIPPERITATGRADYVPVASNTTPQGRAANRRTEIIISPNNEALNALLLGK